MMWADLLPIGVALALCCACMFAAACIVRAGSDELEPEEPTTLERPAVNPANAPLIGALYAVADSIEASGERCAGGLRDIARVLRLTATPAAATIPERVATFVEEHGSAIRREAQLIREV